MMDLRVELADAVRPIGGYEETPRIVDAVMLILVSRWDRGRGRDELRREVDAAAAAMFPHMAE